MESHNIEFCTAIKDTECCLIHKAACELMENSDTIISKYISDFKQMILKIAKAITYWESDGS